MQIENISTLLQGDKSFLSSNKCAFGKLKKQLVKEDIFMEQSPELEHVNFILKKQQQQNKQNKKTHPSQCKVLSHFSRKMIARVAAQDVKPQKMIQASSRIFVQIPERKEKKKRKGGGERGRKKAHLGYCLNY